MNEYLFEDRDARSLARIAQGAETDALAFGHTQKPWVKDIDSALMVNVGSVGKPKNGDTRAAWALLTVGPGQPVQVEMRHVSYDMVNMTDAIRAAKGLPDHFAIDIVTGRAS